MQAASSQLHRGRPDLDYNFPQRDSIEQDNRAIRKPLS
jgi:hypothetical protein